MEKEYHHYWCDNCETKWGGYKRYCDNCKSAKDVGIDEPIIKRPAFVTPEEYSKIPKFKVKRRGKKNKY